MMNLPEPEQIQNAKPYIPKCAKCGDRGYTNCPEARAPDGGDFMAVAFDRGTACTCAQGRWFAAKQLEWIGVK